MVSPRQHGPASWWFSHPKKNMSGLCKNPEPFHIYFFFTRYRFFLWSFNFPSAGFAPWSKNSHEGGKGKGLGREKEGKGTNRKGRGKGKGKEKEKERKRKGKGKENKRKRKGKGKDKEKNKEKGQEKGKKRERKGRGKGRKDRASHGPCLMPKVIVFVIVLLSFVNFAYVPFFLEMAAIIKQKNVATTYQAPSLCGIWHEFVSVPLRQQTMKGRDQKH